MDQGQICVAKAAAGVHVQVEELEGDECGEEAEIEGLSFCGDLSNSPRQIPDGVKSDQ